MINEQLESLERLLTIVRENSIPYAEAKAKRVMLMEYRKSKKALLMNEADSKGVTASNKQETYAYSHPDYIELLKGIQEAIVIEESLNLRIKVAFSRIELFRTEQANQRAEKNAYNASGNR